MHASLNLSLINNAFLFPPSHVYGQVILACAVSLMSVMTRMYAATGLVCKAMCTLSTSAPVMMATLGRPAQRCWTAVLWWIATMATAQLSETATIVVVMRASHEPGLWAPTLPSMEPPDESDLA